MEIGEKEFVKVVDLDYAISQSTSKLIRNLPRFVKQRMKKIICQDELNRIHNTYIKDIGIDYVNSLLSEFNIEVKIQTSGNLDSFDRGIFVANHPLGGIDALAFLHSIHKLKGKVISPSNDLFTYIPNLHPVIVGVDVFSKNNKEKIKHVNEAYMSDAQIMIFPAGMVSRKIKGKVQDIDWQKSFISKSIQTKRPIIPVYISCQNSNKFYRIAKIRKLLGIKMFIETLYLPQEMLKKKNSKIELTFGEPISHTFFDKSKNPLEWAKYVRTKVYEIGNNC